ncbi:NADH-quinone oxidoreductase subunit M [Geitlerinema sp. PCC 9228]|jgi:NAD(P)H-quinone oxidoreductase subunit 4|uniref:NADH-quinone oxidoreductase subunit M n=1 Tax=Geitlerinema sp. PCC 9228 TaxID=111611 RepID=UPI0008F9B5D0|nr:NADH-quinone oxidoreductase subunit M [Geitlerinema sp. PCC 9228]
MLSALIWVPLAGIALIWLLPVSGDRIRSLALTVALGVLAWTVYLGSQFSLTQEGMQFSELLQWVEWIGLNYHLGLDGLSLPLVFLNALLTAIAIYSSDVPKSSKESIPTIETDNGSGNSSSTVAESTVNRPRFYYTLILLLMGGVMGAFLAQDLLLFFLFYELELIPLYFLIAIWGGNRRGYAAMKFLIYTAVSGIVILAAFLGSVWLTHRTSFDYALLREQMTALDADGSLLVPLGAQVALLLGILVGFGIKIPIVPFHTWLPDAHVEASTPISVLLAGVLLKLGTYGLLRFGVGLFPAAWDFLAPALATWAAVSVLYGALTAISQADMKKMVAFSSIAHMGYVLLAAAAATPLSLVAAVAQMVSHGLISALLFLLVGVVGKKTGTRDINVLRGLLNPERGLPVVGTLTILAVMASAGIPGLVGFIAEFLVFRSSFLAFPGQTLLCMVGTGLTAVYFLLMVNRVFFGRLSVEQMPQVKWRDRAPAVVLTLFIFLLGLQPNFMVRWSVTQATDLVPQQSVVRETETAVNFLSFSVGTLNSAQ